MSMPERRRPGARRSRCPTRPAPSIDLADQRGRWTILYFYPKDDTPGCTVEACEFRDANETIPERGADVWGVSPQGAASKRAFREKFGLPFTLLADEEHAVAEAYGSWVEKQNYGKTYMGTARTTFLVDPDGRIARVWPKVKPEGHAAEVLAALDELQAVSAMTARRSRSGDTRRLRSWGETSEASAGSVRRRHRPPQGEASRLTGPRRPHAMTAASRPADHAWRPARFMVIAAHPDDADFGPAGDGRALDRRRVGGLAGVLHERRPGRRGSRRRPARAGGAPRDRAARRGRDHRLRRRHVPPPARRRPGQRPRPARAARPRDPDVPARTPSSPPIPRSIFYRDGGVNHTDHRAAGIAAVDAVYPAARNPMAFPWLARDRPGGARGPPPVPVLVGRSRHAGSTSAATLDRKIDALRAHASQIQRPRRAGRADPGVGGRGGRDRSGPRPPRPAR